jgi:predicted AAA+ superfamily ATPase
LERKINIQLKSETTDYGNSFEQFIICEIYRLNSYLKKDYELTYFRSKDGLEIDLILDRPGQKTALIEIKSKAKVDERDTKHLERFHKDVKNTECFLLSLDKTSKLIGSVQAHHWQKGLAELGFV